MSLPSPSNVIAFPTDLARGTSTCPHCGRVSGTRRFGRILWGYCEQHETRWVNRDFGRPNPLDDRRALRQSLEFLSAFVEVTETR